MGNRAALKTCLNLVLTGNPGKAVESRFLSISGVASVSGMRGSAAYLRHAPKFVTTESLSPQGMASRRAWYSTRAWDPLQASPPAHSSPID